MFSIKGFSSRYFFPKVLDQNKTIPSFLARETTEHWWILIEFLLKELCQVGLYSRAESPNRMRLVRNDEKMNKTWILIPNPCLIVWIHHPDVSQGRELNQHSPQKCSKTLIIISYNLTTDEDLFGNSRYFSRTQSWQKFFGG